MSDWTLQQVLLHNAKIEKGRNPDAEIDEQGVSSESQLHLDIMDHCRKNDIPFLHGSMAHATHRTLGEPDFTLILPFRVVFIECKSKTGKLSTEQIALAAWFQKKGHTIHVVRSMGDFLKVVQG